MGLGQSIADPQYSVAVEKESRNSSQSRTYRNPAFPDELIDDLEGEQTSSLWDLFQLGVRQSPQGPCIGQRRRNGDGSYGSYEWMNYEETERTALQLGAGIEKLQLAPTTTFPDERYEAARSMRLIGVFSRNCIEWLLLEQAANAYGYALVPLYDTLGDDTMVYIADQTALQVLFASLDCLQILKPLLQRMPTLRRVVVFPSPSDASNSSEAAELKATFKAAGVELIPYETVVATGEENFDVRLPFKHKVTRDMVHTLCYTSGTTGAPKGVVFTHGTFLANLCAALRGFFTREDTLVSERDVHYSFLPLAHILERSMCNIMFTCGGCVGVYSGQISRLLDDLKVLNPTIFVAVPRLLKKMDDRISNGVAERSTFSQFLFNLALRRKIENFRATGAVTHKLWDPLIFNKTRAVLGSRIRILVCGGAALDPSIDERVRALLCAPLCQGYGLTETLGVVCAAFPSDRNVGHIGGPTPWVEFRLEAIPEMNYLPTGPQPQGELIVRGPALSKGYFRNGEETDKAFDKDGWFHTGDVVLLKENGSLQIIDRKKNIFKLSQGEYVSAEKIENVYSQAPMVSQVFVYGHSHEAVLVGIVVPDEESSKRWAKSRKYSDTTLSSLVNERTYKEGVMELMEEAAKEAGLKGFEKVKDIRFCTEPFSVENGLMTPTMKLKRFDAKKKFQTEIEDMYKGLHSRSGSLGM